MTRAQPGAHRGYAVPKRCPKCYAQGSFSLEREHKGARMTAQWYCGRCKHAWQARRKPKAPK